MLIHEIPGKLKTNWNASVKAIIDTWIDYDISLEDFKECVLVKGVDHAKANGGVAWIVDSSIAKGAFSQEIQDFIPAEVFPAFQANGIKYFITITAKESSITKLTVSSYASKAGPCGLTLVEAESAEGAVEWLKKNA